MTDVDHRALAALLAHESPAEALVHATLHLADVFAAAWPPMSELMGEGPVPERPTVCGMPWRDPDTGRRLATCDRPAGHGTVHATVDGGGLTW